MIRGFYFPGEFDEFVPEGSCFSVIVQDELLCSGVLLTEAEGEVREARFEGFIEFTVVHLEGDEGGDEGHCFFTPSCCLFIIWGAYSGVILAKSLV